MTYFWWPKYLSSLILCWFPWKFKIRSLFEQLLQNLSFDVNSLFQAKLPDFLSKGRIFQGCSEFVWEKFKKCANLPLQETAEYFLQSILYFLSSHMECFCCIFSTLFPQWCCEWQESLQSCCTESSIIFPSSGISWILPENTSCSTPVHLFERTTVHLFSSEYPKLYWCYRPVQQTTTLFLLDLRAPILCQWDQGQAFGLLILPNWRKILIKFAGRVDSNLER